MAGARATTIRVLHWRWSHSDRVRARVDPRGDVRVSVRAERDRSRPEHAGRGVPGDRRRDPRAAGRRRDGDEPLCVLFQPGVYGSAAQPLQIKVGYYTEIAGLGASPTDVTINGKIEVYNRCLEAGRHEFNGCRARQLLAHAFQPDAQYQLAGQDGVARPRTSGRLAGRVDAPAQHHRRQPLADGLLHGGTAVRERRLHRRLEPRRPSSTARSSSG